MASDNGNKLDWQHTLTMIGSLIIATAGVLFAFYSSQAMQDAKVDAINLRYTTLCTVFNESITRTDQNIQNIGQRLGVSVVTGNQTSNVVCN